VIQNTIKLIKWTYILQVFKTEYWSHH